MKILTIALYTFILGWILGFLVTGYSFIQLRNLEQTVYEKPETKSLSTKTVQKVQKFSFEQNLEQLVNEWRIKNGYVAFQPHNQLYEYAKKRAEEVKTDWSHDGFLRDNCNGTGFVYCGENLSQGFTDENEILQAWLNSPTHRKNIESDYSHMRIACSESYCAQLFGR